ncbi:MAG TPA: Uma2 family endonuclease [Xanthobacteraceae bacterium]
MGVPTIKTGPMSVEEFYAFTDTRPDEEKWELIDGEPVLNASPSPIHQWIVGNLLIALGNRAREVHATWAVLPGLGVRVSDINRPEPDVLIVPRASLAADPTGRDRKEVLVAFEILSPSTEERDLRWKRTAYTNLASLTHYVVIAQDSVEVVVFARDAGFSERRLRSGGESLDLPALGILLPLSEIYRDLEWAGLRVR